MRIGIHFLTPARLTQALAALALVACGAAMSPHRALAGDSEAIAPVTERFAQESIEETPSFQRHVSPLFGRLGCNGRSCHGCVPGPRRLPPLALRLRLQGRSRRAAEGRAAAGQQGQAAGKPDPRQADRRRHARRRPALQEGRLGIPRLPPLARRRARSSTKTDVQKLVNAGSHAGRNPVQQARREGAAQGRRRLARRHARRRDLPLPLHEQQRAGRQDQRRWPGHRDRSGRYARRRLLRQRRDRRSGDSPRLAAQRANAIRRCRRRPRSTSWSFRS